MVRINLVSPQSLSDQHLIAEYREILMIFGIYRKRKIINTSDDNLMHPVQFYKDKLLFLKNRFEKLKNEMISRNFMPKKTLI